MIFVCSHISNIPYTPPEPYHIILPIDYPDKDNIANKVAYRHLRGMYFIWKNLDLFNNPDEICICQHRRHLLDYHIPQGYDIVLPPQDNKLSIYNQWHTCSNAPTHRMEYFEALLEVVPEMKPYTMVPNNPYARFHNMGVYTAQVYKDMCSFLFNTLVIMEDKLDVDPTGDNHCYAFLAERLADYWCWAHKELKVYESPILSYSK